MEDRKKFLWTFRINGTALITEVISHSHGRDFHTLSQNYMQKSFLEDVRKRIIGAWGDNGVDDTKAKLNNLLRYLEEFARLSDTFISDATKYSDLSYFEHELTGREGVSCNIEDSEGPIWLKIDRLLPQEPPEPSEHIQKWIKVSDDPTKHCQVLEQRMETMSKARAEQLVHEGLVDSKDVMSPLKSKGKTPESMQPSGAKSAATKESVDVRLRLDRLPDIEQSLRSYVAKWEKWAEQERPRRQTMAIYRSFFTLARKLASGGADVSTEVIMGVGVLSWKTEDMLIRHPIVEMQVEVESNSSTGSIMIRPRQIVPALYLKPLIHLENSAVNSLRDIARTMFTQQPTLVDANGTFLANEWNPFQEKLFETILRTAVSKISDNAVYAPDMTDGSMQRHVPVPGTNAVITNTWAIYARPRNTNQIVHDIERFSNSLKELESIPGVADRFVSELDNETTTHFGIDLESGISTHDDFHAEEMQKPGIGADDLFFPKPYNENQSEIIRLLENSDGLVVQGPPGTGKTHTIANIVCHYLATGRSILVTSKGAPALQVLREQIPEEIRPLVVSLLQQDREGQKQLEHAVSYIDKHVMTQHPRDIKTRLVELERTIVNLRNQLNTINNDIQKSGQRLLAPIEWDGDKVHPVDLALLVAEKRELFSWLEDEMTLSSAFDLQFNEDDIQRLRAARLALGSDLCYINHHVPQLEDLPEVGEIVRIHEDLNHITTLSASIDKPLALTMSERVKNPEVLIQNTLRHFEALALHLEHMENASWLLPLYTRLIYEDMGADETRIIESLISDIARLLEMRQPFVEKPVDLPQWELIDSTIQKRIDKAAAGGRLLPLNPFAGSKLKPILDQIKVTDQRPTTAEDWQHVKAYIAYADTYRGIASRWNAMASTIDLPSIDSNAYMAFDLEKHYKILVTAFEIATHKRNEIVTELKKLYPGYLLPKEVWLDDKLVKYLIDVLQSDFQKLRLSMFKERLVEWEKRLGSYSGPVVDEIIAFFEQKLGSVEETSENIVEQWNEITSELQRVIDLNEHIQIVTEVTAKIQASGGYRWAHTLRSESVTHSNEDPHLPHTWQEAWRLRRAYGELKIIDQSGHLQQITHKKHDVEKQLQRAMEELVKVRTHAGIHKRMTPARLSALRQFSMHITALGAGTGKKAPALKAKAREALEQCKDAVPCWIMPSWRVSETLPSEFGNFDLIIVDEASQSDVFTLPVLFRAKKVLIVGDDRQVSPVNIGIEVRKMLQLEHAFLKELPHKALFAPEKSIYDLGTALFPDRTIMLNEHFRCVEPIIRFSFQFYPEPIVPLRLPKASERLNPPLIDVYVKDGVRGRNRVNKPEAHAIVDEINKLVHDPKFQGRSIGVVSLIGSQQAAYIHKLLYDTIGDQRIANHDIVCGDAATFQGNEKDIMFVSMVASPNHCNAQIARMFEQRFNVALSRAKDRMYLFRSVTLQDLRNENDLKRKVIEHFADPLKDGKEPPEDLLELCESNFEKDVFTELSRRGYNVTPQVVVGNRRIDLVVEGENDRRLAIELDGDKYHGPDKWLEDWSRQTTLERVGWTFWRCWASTYYLDPDAAMTDLVAKLDEMGIAPGYTESEAYRYVEYRKVSEQGVTILSKPIEHYITDQSIKVAPAYDQTVSKASDIAESDAAVAMKEKEVNDFDANTSANVLIEDEKENYVGDNIVAVFNDGEDGQRTFTLVDEETDLLNGVVSIHDPMAADLALTPIDEEVVLTLDGRTRRMVIIDRTRERYTSAKRSQRSQQKLDEWRYAR